MEKGGSPQAINRKIELTWLLTPSLANLGFAVRTSVAAILSLFIAIWLQLGSPQWAPLTVWVVATASRGESLSKARWRLIGTGIGCFMGVGLMACFPQQSGLFFISLAFWIGLCCGSATFFNGYRRYGLLVVGFTSAIVATGAIENPDNVFDVAISRGTYIVLGNVCEAVMAALFLNNISQKARVRLLEKLSGLTNDIETYILTEGFYKTDLEDETRFLQKVVASDTRIEFDALEMGPAARRAPDHARAVLAHLLTVLVSARGGEGQKKLERNIEVIRSHIQAIEVPRTQDHFTFKARPPRHLAEALQNGIRAAIGIIGAWLLWEVTAWSSGPAFVSFVALIYGLLATRDVPVLASSGFFQGAVWCTVVAGLYVFLIIPSVTAPEYLTVLLMIPMIIGGLAARTPFLVNHAFSFNMFLPVLIGPSNSGRYDEISFLNGTSAFLGAVLFVWITFGVVLPFRADQRLKRRTFQMERSLRALGISKPRLSVEQWLASNANSMVRLIETSQNVPHKVLLDYIDRHMQIMVLGMWITELWAIATTKQTPQPIRNRLRVVLRSWSRTGDTDLTKAAFVLRNLERTSQVSEELLTALRGLSKAPVRKLNP
ncbi:FUSC family protein [Gluconobacter sp. OJA]|uniref:FUSC family protein n=2 Tax=Gluconobacter sp. OJA TaxID=3145197 RepID=UPI0031F7C6E8